MSLPPISLLLYEPDNVGPPYLPAGLLTCSTGESTEQCLSHIHVPGHHLDLIKKQILSRSGPENLHF